MDKNEVQELIEDAIAEHIRDYEYCPVCKAHTTFIRVGHSNEDAEEMRRAIRCLWCNSLFEVKKELVRVE